MIPTVFLVDDNVSCLTATSRLLRANGFSVQPFASAREFLLNHNVNNGGCVVADLQMPEIGGLELQATLAQSENALPIIILTGFGDIPLSVRAMRDGAEDFLEKRAPKEQLLEAVRRAIARDEAQRSARLKTQDARARFERLSERELEVLALILRGSLNKQIADDLGICERTVKLHRMKVKAKVGVQSVAELAQLAQEAGVFAGVAAPDEGAI